MLASKQIGALLAICFSAFAKPILSRQSRSSQNVGQCSNTHLPTEELYLQGVTQYCNNHFKQGVTLKDKDEVVVTIDLRDKSDSKVQWIYKIRWEDDSSMGEGPIEINQATCLAKFRVWAEDEMRIDLAPANCMDGDTKLIMGGKYVAGGSSLVKNLNRPGSKLWIETRQKRG